MKLGQPQKEDVLKKKMTSKMKTTSKMRTTSKRKITLKMRTNKKMKMTSKLRTNSKMKTTSKSKKKKMSFLEKNLESNPSQDHHFESASISPKFALIVKVSTSIQYLHWGRDSWVKYTFGKNIFIDEACLVNKNMFFEFCCWINKKNMCCFRS